MRRNNIPVLLVVWVIFSLIQQACAASTATETPTPEPPEPTSVPSDTVVPTDTPVPTPQDTATPTLEPSPTVAPGYEAALVYVGRWEGSWRNITFGSNGPIEGEFLVYPDGTAEISVDVGGFVFGMVDPDPITFAGTYNETEAIFELFNDPVFGYLIATISAVTNEITLVGEIIPDSGIASLEASGMFTENTINTEYTVVFATGGQAVGEANLTKVEE